jgi:hypothetical protein
MNAQLWTDDRLDELRRTGDPLADDLVARFFKDEGPELPRHLLGRLVIHDDLPEGDRSPAVDAYFREQPPLPAWADPHRIRRGEAIFCEWGPLVGASLFCASLPDSYAAARGVQVLHLTARLATDTQRRIYETAQMVVDVMSPGGLSVGAAGYREARRVRLMHAAVRHLIQHDSAVAHTCDPKARGPHWCDQWGLPVNQEDLLGTLMTFTVVIFESLRRFGVRLSEEDAESYLHAWNVVGHLLGIKEELLPIELSSAEELWAAVRRRQWAPSPEGAEMTAALIRLLEGEMPPGLRRLPRSLVRYLVGDTVADMVEVGPPGQFEGALFGPARRVMSLLALTEGHNRMARLFSERLGRAMFEALLLAERGGSRASFAIPPSLADQWGLQVRDADP